MTSRKTQQSVSFVIPVFNEESSLALLFNQLSRVIKQESYAAEIIFVDDGSTDGSNNILSKLARARSFVHLITLRANFGKSAALSQGFKRAKHDIIVTLDADLQDKPGEIPHLIEKLASGFDLVTGWRKNRKDSRGKRFSSKLFNAGAAFATGVYLHDFNCGLKAMKRQVASDLPMYGELHRFIPILAAKMKYHVAEISISHDPRRFGKSKYGLARSWKGIIDLMTTVFISDYSTKPAHFFGKIGLVFLATGLTMDGYVTYLKITTGSTQDKIPLLLAGILCIVIGVQLFSTGLIAEFIAQYQIRNAQPNLVLHER